MVLPDDDRVDPHSATGEAVEQVDEAGLENLLEYLRNSRGFDFTGYKRAGLARRIRKRMQGLGLNDYESYQDYLEVHPEEFTHLFNTVLINVTSFFRDATAWDYLRKDIIPRIVNGDLQRTSSTARLPLDAFQPSDSDRGGAERGSAVLSEPAEQIRVWCAGVASGEEAYTAAMILAEALGEKQYADRVKIYATDIDDEALARARQATYSERDLASVPPDLLAKYFERSQAEYVFSKNLRRTVIFGRHDLLQDAPISRVDLLICRNTLMYFNVEAQSRILNRFHFALKEGGILFLGRAEMLFAHSHLFKPVEPKSRVFAKVTKGNPRYWQVDMLPNADSHKPRREPESLRFREAACDACSAAHLAIDANGFLGMANERARALFGLTTRDLGRPFQELEFVYRIVGLRALVEQARAERKPASTMEVEWETAIGDARYLNVHAVPLLDNTGMLLGASLTFIDVTNFHKLQEALGQTNQDLETAYEEVQSTNEELETTNEELQSTVEELETTTEELQSTNEELQTMNEELQSTNEEMDTINQELRERTDELRQSNGFLESILSSLRSAVVVLDRDLRIMVWNAQAADFWGLRADEVTGQHFMNLDSGLPVELLHAPLRGCLLGESPYQELVVTATNRRGKEKQYKVSCAQLRSGGDSISGVIVMMQEVEC